MYQSHWTELITFYNTAKCICQRSCDLKLSNNRSELLASRLKWPNLAENPTNIPVICTGSKRLFNFFFSLRKETSVMMWTVPRKPFVNMIQKSEAYLRFLEAEEWMAFRSNSTHHLYDGNIRQYGSSCETSSMINFLGISVETWKLSCFSLLYKWAILNLALSSVNGTAEHGKVIIQRDDGHFCMHRSKSEEKYHQSTSGWYRSIFLPTCHIELGLMKYFGLSIEMQVNFSISNVSFVVQWSQNQTRDIFGLLN